MGRGLWPETVTPRRELVLLGHRGGDLLGDGEAGHVDEAGVFGAGFDDEGASLDVAFDDGIAVEDHAT